MGAEAPSTLSFCREAYRILIELGRAYEEMQ